MRINNIENNNLSGLKRNNEYLKFNNIMINNQSKYKIKNSENYKSQAPIKRFQKSSLKNGNLVSNKNKIKENPIIHDMDYFPFNEKNNHFQIIKENKNFNHQNLYYHEIDMTTKKKNFINYNEQNINNYKIKLNDNKNQEINYNINNNKVNNYFKEILRKNDEIKKYNETFFCSKLINEKNGRISKNPISNYQLREELRTKSNLNNQKNNNFINKTLAKKEKNTTKINNFRNSSIQIKNLQKQVINDKQTYLRNLDKTNKQNANYKKYQSIKKFFNCKIDENDSFILLKKDNKKYFNQLETKNNAFFSLQSVKKKNLLEPKMNDNFLIKGKKLKKIILKKETPQQFLFEEKKRILKEESIHKFLLEGKKEEKKDNMTAKEKIQEILKQCSFTKEEIREILREFHIIINPNIEEKKQKNDKFDENNIKNVHDDYLIRDNLNRVIDNDITPCKNEKKNKKEKKEILLQKEKIGEDLNIYQKIYGFKNIGNNCYLNSSLQLLTRIKELKDNVFNFKENYEDNDTQGKLIIEFRNLLEKIENSPNNNLILNPGRLKRTMGDIDSKYFSNGQEDSNEFIANFLNGLLSETGNKEVSIKKLNIINELDKKPYESLYKKFFKKKGDSFIINLFYGILKTKKFCKNCGKNNSIKFNVYNILEFQLHILTKKKLKKEYTLKELFENYYEEKKTEDDSCSFCNSDKIYTKTKIYTLPKYLMICIQRSSDKEYAYNNVIYQKKLEINCEFENAEKSYILDCVIEHSGGVGFGHYTSLIPMDKGNNTWWRFSDSYWSENNVGYQSENAFILLYKLINF